MNCQRCNTTVICVLFYVCSLHVLSRLQLQCLCGTSSEILKGALSGVCYMKRARLIDSRETVQNQANMCIQITKA